ncbi:hypothetical protein A6M27_14990 [Acidithiobacillus thiooxidans]|uniref:SMODS and SLOG-associating 2TM effector domain-containing protein n=1 Tax=Acidithiobacillus thiooxidans TaxID=930 RepID=A0A1C2I9F4_ACITH|nr:hypothetical protein [Acidithiobacillus thiooxidans]OCX72619.1 hypothetical protein A6O24_13685 [Acidithiobacillus thiooxidans]OCX75119.1 hypothetical protein A6P07_04645 [Acidithiobacillus thiooxidans]OCX79772.1 hypothetical protein A6O26_16025 [Acidithiobacillus thiooxidans]OCX85575.1 hypothetical protein A6M27_14990 [Acidithiobacillus thiooxidans]OFC41848.1 hypothetical protein BAE47_16960 [Acidithiobacillus thiooxidans]
MSRATDNQTFLGQPQASDNTDSLYEDSSALLPLVLGVTGHRDIPDSAYLSELLKTQITTLRQQYPSTPMVALSALAEGADRIFAQTALDAGLPLYVPLPFSPEEYEKDFPDNVEAFRALCAKATAVFTVPLAPGVTPENLCLASGETGNAWRNWQYAMAGIYLAQRAHILFSLWDGQPAAGLGGTAQIVRYRQIGRLDIQSSSEEDRLRLQALAPFSLLDDPANGLICHIKVRPGQQTGQDALPPPEWLPEKPADYAPLRQMDAYNAQAQKVSVPLSKEASHGTLRPADQEAERLHRKEKVADALANQHVQNTRKYFLYIFYMAGGMVVSHELYAEIHPLWIFLLIYLLLLGGIGWLVWFMRHQHKNSLAVDYRTLAEGLRVQGAWYSSGLPDLVSQHYLRRHSASLGWVRVALQGVCLHYYAEANTADIQKIRKDWIEVQATYYTGSVTRRERVIKRLSHVSTWFYLFGLVAMLVILPIRLGLWVPDRLWLPTILGFIIGLLPAVAGLLAGYLEFAGYKDDVREHTLGRDLFTRVDQELAQDPPFWEKQALIRELGIEALTEHGNWALLHKNHDAKVIEG